MLLFLSSCTGNQQNLYGWLAAPPPPLSAFIEAIFKQRFLPCTSTLHSNKLVFALVSGLYSMPHSKWNDFKMKRYKVSNHKVKFVYALWCCSRSPLFVGESEKRGKWDEDERRVFKLKFKWLSFPIVSVFPVCLSYFDISQKRTAQQARHGRAVFVLTFFNNTFYEPHPISHSRASKAVPSIKRYLLSL